MICRTQLDARKLTVLGVVDWESKLRQNGMWQCDEPSVHVTVWIHGVINARVVEGINDLTACGPTELEGRGRVLARASAYSTTSDD